MFKRLGLVEGGIYLFGSILHSLIDFISFLKNRSEFRRLKADGKVLTPPWLEYPEIRWSSIGWRMGGGESYLMKWDRWYGTLSIDEKLNYQNRFPAPEDWKRFYNSRDE